MDNSIVLDHRLIDNFFVSSDQTGQVQTVRNNLSAPNGIEKKERIYKDRQETGESFDIKILDSEWILRDKLHKILAAHENTFRTIIYMSHDPSFAVEYVMKVKKIFQYPFLSTKFELELNDHANLTKYLNFSLATVSYVKENTVNTRIIKLDSRSDDKKGVEEIFHYMRKVLIQTNKLESIELIILDIHSTFKMNKNCRSKAQDLLDEFKSNGKTLIINHSFFFKNNDDVGDDVAGDYDNDESYHVKAVLIQKKIKLNFLKIKKPFGPLPYMLEFILENIKNELENYEENSFILDPQLFDRKSLILDSNEYNDDFENALNQLTIKKKENSDFNPDQPQVNRAQKQIMQKNVPNEPRGSRSRDKNQYQTKKKNLQNESSGSSGESENQVRAKKKKLQNESSGSRGGAKN